MVAFCTQLFCGVVQLWRRIATPFDDGIRRQRVYNDTFVVQTIKICAPYADLSAKLLNPFGCGGQTSRAGPSVRRWFQYAWVAFPDPETIRHTAREVVRRPDYQVTPVPNRGATLLALFWQLVHWILSPFAWLFDALEGLPDWLRWFVVVGLALLVVVLMGHIIYTLVTALRGPKRSRAIGLDDLQRPTDPAVFEQQAEHAAGQDDFITAIRLLFRACLVRLARSEKRTYRPGLTNREHLRRYYGTSFFKSLTVFVKTIDMGWYGDRTCVRNDYEACHAAHGQIQRFLEESRNAHGT